MVAVLLMSWVASVAQAADGIPEQAFLNVGTIEEAMEKGKKLLEQAKK